MRTPLFVVGHSDYKNMQIILFKHYIFLSIFGLYKKTNLKNKNHLVNTNIEKCIVIFTTYLLNLFI